MTDVLYFSKLYDQDLLPVTCKLKDIDLTRATVAQITKHMNDFVLCLMDSWYGPVEDSGFYMPRPSVTVYSDTIITACGQSWDHNAFYCLADQQIYFAQNLVELYPDSWRTQRFLGEAIMAHEFGHAIQFRTQILSSINTLEYIQVTEEDAWELNRRMELQADCLAGVFMNSISTSVGITEGDVSNIRSYFEHLGSDFLYMDDHGAGVNRSWWSGRGLATTHVGDCNTYNAPPEIVG